MDLMNIIKLPIYTICITSGLCRKYNSFKPKSVIGNRLFSDGKYDSKMYGPCRVYFQEDLLKIFPRMSKNRSRFYMTPAQLRKLG